LAQLTQPAFSYKVLLSFGGGADGKQPVAGLAHLNGLLYGTTFRGGLPPSGTAYRMSANGEKTILHNFGVNGSDGAFPRAGLLHAKGTLYGTTELGGAFNLGTIYRINGDGTEEVLHSFAGGPDGDRPVAGLIEVFGTLYGTTEYGGRYGHGTVYRFVPGVGKTVLHSFSGYDGDHPESALVNDNGWLYGTTVNGGAHGDGVVYVVANRDYKVVHDFNGADGALPIAALINVNGTLYGTTVSGGAFGNGTVYAVDNAVAERILHSFDGYDGSYPNGALIEVNGKMYGTTVDGGAFGNGTVYSVWDGGEKVLHDFEGGASGDGAQPYAALTNMNGTLYGTTFAGGTSDDGTVFALTP
jgi:uncharacterized repeat protein (TIGR03803 family)